MTSIATLGLLTMSVWTALAAPALVAPTLAAETKVLIGFAAATSLCALALWSATPRGLRAPAFSAGRLPQLLALAAIGHVSHPLWLALIAAVGLGSGLEAQPIAAAPGISAPGAVSILALAPLFEEILYRRLWIPALQRRIGSLPAVVVTSLLFAIPHLDQWAVLGTFLVGLMLGALYLATRSTASCIAMHAGLNLAGLQGPPSESLDHAARLTLIAALIAAPLHSSRRRGVGARRQSKSGPERGAERCLSRRQS